ncbi:MAG: Replication factor C small subunit, partial [Nanoarchaeota archaeon]
MNAIWTEKFRPQKFGDLKGQRKIVERIEAFVRQKNMPHLLLAGPPGTGKTSLTWV